MKLNQQWMRSPKEIRELNLPQNTLFLMASVLQTEGKKRVCVEIFAISLGASTEQGHPAVVSGVTSLAEKLCWLSSLPTGDSWECCVNTSQLTAILYSSLG